MIARAAEANMSCFRSAGILDPVQAVVPLYIRIVSSTPLLMHLNTDRHTGTRSGQPVSELEILLERHGPRSNAVERARHQAEAQAAQAILVASQVVSGGRRRL